MHLKKRYYIINHRFDFDSYLFVEIPDYADIYKQHLLKEIPEYNRCFATETHCIRHVKKTFTESRRKLVKQIWIQANGIPTLQVLRTHVYTFCKILEPSADVIQYHNYSLSLFRLSVLQISSIQPWQFKHSQNAWAHLCYLKTTWESPQSKFGYEATMHEINTQGKSLGGKIQNWKKFDPPQSSSIIDVE